jgi:tetratricopeptide (TPR) repeat protein
MLPPARMLTTKNECEDGRWKGIFRQLHFLIFFVTALALAGCGPAGSHALLKGIKLLNEGDYADAADELKSATEIMTTNAEAWNYLGDAEQHAGQYEEAASAYQRALELDRDLMEAHYNLGCLRLEQNRPNDAVTEFTAYTLRRPNTPEGWLKLGLAQLRMKDLLPAEKSFSTALYQDANNAEAYNGLGLARIARGRPEDAEKFFQAAVQYHPDYGPAILNLATVEHQYLHDDRLALENYRAYLALNPHPANWDEVNALANSLQQSPTTMAMASPPENQQSPPSPPPVRQNTAPPPETREPETRPQTERTTQQRPQVARTNYGTPREQTETVQVQPEQPIATAPSTGSSSAPKPVTEPDMFASVAEKNQSGSDVNSFNWSRPTQTQTDMKVTPLPPVNSEHEAPRPVHIAQAAPPAFARYLYLHPGKPASGNRRSASAAFQQARVDEGERRFTDALDSYRQATQLDPGWFEAEYNCGVMAYRLRDFAFSLQAYETALAIEPDSTDARYNFALALKAAGYVPDAVDELKRILAINPNDVRSHLELGNLYAQQLRDVPRARAEYLEVLQLDPGNPQASNIQFWLSANPP